jgi:methyltransferase (TIGR00027 family)
MPAVMANKRIATKASRTAAYNCFSRACATREKDPRFRGPDNLAEVILPPIPRFMLDFVPLRKLLMRMMFPPGIYEYVYARTKVFDATFLHAMEDCLAQIVLLGAGFDTRALRFADNNQGTKIFELDVPTTQVPKLDIFRKKKLILPPELVFASIDFDTEDIFTILTEAGYQDGAKTLFLWEGVCMYLTGQAVDDTLGFVCSHAAPGSQIIFDYIYASVLRRENRYYGEQGIFETVARTGENWTFGLEEGEVEPFLAAHGFEMLAHYTPIQLERLYLTAEDGTIHGRVNGTHCIVLAAVK